MKKMSAKQKILYTAKLMFQENGYIQSTTKEIARRAEVNEVTIFRHFGSKENLFNEVMDSITTIAVFDDDFAKKFTGDLETDLTLYANRYLEAAKERIMLINMGLMEGVRDPEMGRLVGKIALKITGFLAEHLENLREQGKIPANDFQLVSEMFYSMLYQYIISNYSIAGSKNILQVEQTVIVKKSVHAISKLLMQK